MVYPSPGTLALGGICPPFAYLPGAGYLIRVGSNRASSSSMSRTTLSVSSPRLPAVWQTSHRYPGSSNPLCSTRRATRRFSSGVERLSYRASMLACLPMVVFICVFPVRPVIRSGARCVGGVFPPSRWSCRRLVIPVFPPARGGSEAGGNRARNSATTEAPATPERTREHNGATPPEGARGDSPGAGASQTSPRDGCPREARHGAPEGGVRAASEGVREGGGGGGVRAAGGDPQTPGGRRARRRLREFGAGGVGVGGGGGAEGGERTPEGARDDPRAGGEEGARHDEGAGAGRGGEGGGGETEAAHPGGAGGGGGGGKKNHKKSKPHGGRGAQPPARNLNKILTKRLLVRLLSTGVTSTGVLENAAGGSTEASTGRKYQVPKYPARASTKVPVRRGGGGQVPYRSTAVPKYQYQGNAVPKYRTARRADKYQVPPYPKYRSTAFGEYRSTSTGVMACAEVLVPQRGFFSQFDQTPSGVERNY